jgi:hypothetical protein
MLPLLTLLALKIPDVDVNGGEREILAPSEIPTGGIEPGGKGNIILLNSITLLLVTTIILSLFFLIFGGIKWTTSSGDKAKLDSARKTIIYALVGLIISFLSFFIISIIGSFFGVTLIALPFVPSDCSGQGPC